MPYGLTGEEGRERIRKLFRRMRLLMPVARPLGLAARMTADQHAEINIEAQRDHAAIAPVLDRVTCPVRYVLATGANLGGSTEEMEQVRASLESGARPQPEPQGQRAGREQPLPDPAQGLPRRRRRGT